MAHKLIIPNDLVHVRRATTPVCSRNPQGFVVMRDGGAQDLFNQSFIRCPVALSLWVGDSFGRVVYLL